MRYLAPIAPAALAALAACSSLGQAPPTDAVPTDRPYAVVLGTAQDAGRPQLGCELDCCAGARHDPGARRLVTSIAVVDPRSGQRWLLDASPDLEEQVALLSSIAPPADHAGRPGRPALFDGIVLTHAHIGHYLGLAELGREAYGSAPQPVVATPSMAAFLRDNGPWSLLVEAGHVHLVELAPGRTLSLADDLFVELLSVPHRDEFSDTVAIRVTGPGGALLYLPDIDKWEVWERELSDELLRVDHAFLDATFFGPDELPGRAMSEVPHPFVVETIEALADLPATERAKVHLTHLNHTNPLNEPDSEARATVDAAGLSVAYRGQVVGL